MTRSLCITGMHRSGTSLTASWLERCGVAIDDGEVWGPDDGNVLGHFEDKSFVDLHSAQILRHRSRSRGWKVFPDTFFTFDAQGLSRARQLAARREQKYDCWSWKDPRTVLFLQQWKALLPRMACLIVWRPWPAVAGSLIRRSAKTRQPHLKISAIEAVRLYKCYGDLICRYKLQHPDDTLLLPLELVLEDDQRVFRLITEKFNLQLEYQPLRDQFDTALLYRGDPPALVRLIGRLWKTSETEENVARLMDAGVDS